MKIIKPSYSIINELDINKKIERVARVCYKSEDMITEGSSIRMVKNLLKRQHTAMLEHASIAVCVDFKLLKLLKNTLDNLNTVIQKNDSKSLKRNYLRYSTRNADTDTARYIVSGNIRAWYEAFTILNDYEYALPAIIKDEFAKIAPGIFDDFNYTNSFYIEDYDKFKIINNFKFEIITDFSILSSEEKMIHEDISVLFTVDRGVTHEMVRHRDCSFAQESTRYCNYSLGKYNNEITVIEPCFIEKDSYKYNIWKQGCEQAEQTYFQMIESGIQAQGARSVLPTSVKADIVMTANLREWKHILNLRACDSTGPAHPQIKEIMVPLLKELKQKYCFEFQDLEISENN